MPKITIEPENRGRIQETGSVGVGGVKSLQTLTGDDETIDTSGFVIAVDPDGARTGTILEAGVADGQLILLLNEGGQSITFAAAGDSNFAAGAVALAAGGSALCVWDATNSKWSPTSQSLS